MPNETWKKMPNETWKKMPNETWKKMPNSYNNNIIKEYQYGRKYLL